MKLFAIVLCIVLGHTFGDVQRVEIGKDDLKANENVMETVSLEAKDTFKPDQNIRSKYIHVPSQSVTESSIVTDTSKKPSSVVTPTKMTSGAFVVENSRKRAYLGRSGVDFRSLLKHPHRHLSPKKASLEIKRSLPRMSAATQTTDTSISVKTRRLFRMKRYSVIGPSIDKIPTVLWTKLDATALADKTIFKSYIETNSAPPNLFADFEKARNEEREMFKQKLAEVKGLDADDLITSYKDVKDQWYGTVNSVHKKFPDFFKKPSAALTEYEKFRQKDFASFDSFMSEIMQSRATATLMGNKTEVTTTQANEISKSQEAKPEKVRKIDPSKISATSYSVMQYFLNKLPSVLKDRCLMTDDAEKVVLENYVRSQSVPTDALESYNSAKKEERELLKRLSLEMPGITSTYKALRKGVAWNYTRLNDKYTKFFHQPSTALTQFEALKNDEFASLDSFLADSSQIGAQEGTKNTEAEEAGKGKNEEAGKGKNEDSGKGKNEDAGKGKADNAETRKSEEAGNRKAEEEKRKAEEKPKDDDAQKQRIKESDKGKSEDSEKHKIEETNKPEKSHDEGSQIKERGDIPYCGPNKQEIKVDINGGEKEEILNAHNDERLSEEATNMFRLVWDDELARIAQYKANNCGFFHSDLRNCNNSNISQNLYADWAYTNATPMIYLSVNYRQVIKVWADERNDWDWKTLTCAPKKMCGHWLTLTGAASRRIGCGKAACPKMEVFGEIRNMANLVVCDYLPSSSSYERGTHCSHCRSSTAQLGEDERGHTCHNDMCVPCDIRTNEMCRCGRPDSCQNGGKFSTKICRCNCTREYDGPFCATRALTIQGRPPA